MLILFSSTMFVSAVLLFWIQPMFSKMVLPLLGGTPGVWNTCMVFYQGALLAGYACAHLSIHWLGVRKQAILHCVILAIGFLFLPVSMMGFSSPPTTGTPVFWLLLLLTACIGWPFWVISFTAPMLQRWFSRTFHGEAHDPYFLYAASNIGSLVALLGYPLLIEPYLRLPHQAWAWSVGYGLLFLLTAISAVVLWRTHSGKIEANTESPNNGTAISNSDRARWFLFALVPSSMLLGVTTYMTTDVAAVPMLWVVPLAVYLCTFVLVFARKTLFRHPAMLRIQPYLLAPPVLLFFWGAKVPLIFNFPLHLSAFFIHTMVCHGELARRRPSPAHLTEFYLWMAAGGMAGGIFNAMAAPYLFNAPLEYPLAIAAAAMLRARTGHQKPKTRRYAYGLLAGLAVLLAGPLAQNPDVTYHIGIGGLLIVSSLFAAYFFAWVNRPVILGLVFAVLILGGFRFNDAYSKVLHRQRGFFGPLLVRMDPKEENTLFYHGTTIHGAQCRDPENRMRPLTYFTQNGPLGQIMTALNEVSPTPRKMAITGLGAGSIASYGRACDRIDYFEIDPNVVSIAQNTDYFTFLRDTPALISITLGDARLTLAEEPDDSYDVIIMDAFSSGSIPTHLLTLEAFQLLQKKLKDDGLLIYQISNRFLDLEPVLASLAEQSGWAGLIQRDTDVTFSDRQQMIYPSVWVVMENAPKIAPALTGIQGWETLRPAPAFPVWTDDFSNILSVMKPPKWD